MLSDEKRASRFMDMDVACYTNAKHKKGSEGM